MTPAQLGLLWAEHVAVNTPPAGGPEHAPAPTTNGSPADLLTFARMRTG